jgi:hypothetical protein
MSDMTYAVHTATCTYLLDEDGICRWTEAPAGAAPPGVERCVGAQFVACLDLGTEGGLVGELRVGASALLAREEGGRFVLLRTLPIEHVEIRDPAAPAESFVEAPLPPLPEPSHPHDALPAFSREEPWDLPQSYAAPASPLPPVPYAAPPPPAPRPVFDPLTEPFPSYAASYSLNIEETAVLEERWAALEEEALEQLDIEDLLSISVTEVTLSLPLYRPPPRAPVPQAPPPTRPPPAPPLPAPGPAAGRLPQPRPRVVGPGGRLR